MKCGFVMLLMDRLIHFLILKDYGIFGIQDE